MKKANKKFIIWLTLAASLMLAYHNCAPVQFDMNQTASIGAYGTFSVDEDQVLYDKIEVAAEDGVLALELHSSPQHGEVQLSADGKFVFTPTRDFNGEDSFVFRSEVGSGKTKEIKMQRVFIVVNPINDTPSIENTEVEILTNQDFDIAVAFHDVDSTVVGIYPTSDRGVLQKNLASGALVMNTRDQSGKVSFRPARNSSSTESFEVYAIDAEGAISAPATIRVSFRSPRKGNPQPVFTISEDGMLNTSLVEFSAFKEDSVVGEFSLLGAPNVLTSNGKTLSPITLSKEGTLNFAPSPDFFGTIDVPYQEILFGTYIFTGKIRVEVTSVNDLPVFRGANVNLARNTPASGIVSATDVEGPVTIGIDGVSGTTYRTLNGGQLTLNGEAFSYFPATGFLGTDEVKLKVIDTDGAVVRGTLTFYVTSPNYTPQANSFQLNEDTVNFMAQLTKGYSSAVTFELISQPTAVQSNGKQAVSQFSLSAAGGISYTPGSDFFGQIEIRYYEVLNQYEKTEARAVVTVVAVNDSPVLTGTTNVEVTNNATINFSLAGNDIEDGTIKIDLAQTSFPSQIASAHGLVRKVSPATGVRTTTAQFSYTPDSTFRGRDTIRIYGLDTQGGVSTLDIQFMVTNPIQQFKPAAAIKATGCISCHMNITGNLISDFGFPTNPFGMNEYKKHGVQDPNPMDGNVHRWIDNSAFIKSSIVRYSAYGFHFDRLDTSQPADQRVSSWAGAQINSGSLILPATTLNWTNYNTYLDTLKAHYQTLVGTESYSDWQNLVSFIAEIKSFNGNTLENLMKRVFSNTGATITTTPKSQVMIRLPTTTDIYNAAANVPSTNIMGVRYSPDIVGVSPDLSGLTYANGYVTNVLNIVNGVNQLWLTCDGDLFIDKPVHFKHLKIKTLKGCRIYSTHSIFITGGISYDLTYSTDANLQLVSSVGIFMGLGSTVSPSCPIEKNSSEAAFNAVDGRVVDFSMLGVPNSLSLYNQIKADAVIADPMPVLSNGSNGYPIYNCGNASQDQVQQRNFDRLLTVAPHVHSKYMGSYKGAIIAEVALLYVGRFSFEFDPVLTRVPLIPLLNPDSYLVVK